MSKVYEKIEKSLEDHRLYRGLVLSNEMRVMLISDNKTTKSGAALCVKIGYNEDPENISGLASLCARMKFMGSKKNPDVDKYSNFMKQNGGFSNSMTYANETKFLFEIEHCFFIDALDIFAQYFTSPLFAEAQLQSQIDVIELEYLNLILNNTWRDDYIFSYLHNPVKEKPRLGCGNRYLLQDVPQKKGINVYEELLKFHDKYYSSNIMSLVLLGQMTLDGLQDIAQKMFSPIINKNIELPIRSVSPCDSKLPCNITYIVPARERSALRLYFSMPDLKKYYKTSPDFYLTYLLKYEGHNSLLAYLKSHDWLTAFDTDIIEEFGISYYILHLELTPGGLNQVQLITKSVFHYMKLLMNEGPQKWIFDECSKIKHINFRFKDKHSMCYYMHNLVSNLLNYPICEAVVTPYIMSEYNADILNMALQSLKPESACINIVDMRYKEQCTETDSIIGIQYHTETLTENQIKQLGICPRCQEFEYPKPNELIPNDFDLVPLHNVTPYPVLIYDTPLSRMWFKQDSDYKTPQLSIKVMVSSPRTYIDPLSCNLTEMFVDLVQYELSKETFDARPAGLMWHIVSTKQGFIVNIEGISEKIHILLIQILNKIRNLEVDYALFEKLEANYENILKNLNKEQPYLQAIYYMNAILSEQEWTKDLLLDACKQTTAKNLQSFIPILFSNLHVESFVYGNCNEERALNIARIIEQHLKLQEAIPLFTQQLNNIREYKLEPQRQYLYNVENAHCISSCTNIFYQCGTQKLLNKVILDLLLRILQKPSHETLKVKEKLGYFIFCVARRTSDTQGLRIIIQSDLPPLYIDYRIEKFLEDMKSHLMVMTNEELEYFKRQMIEELITPPKTMLKTAEIYWEEIESQRYYFNKSTIEVACLKNISMQQLLNFFMDYIEISGRKRSKLSVFITPIMSERNEKVNLEVPLKYYIIDDIESFQKTKGLFSLIDNTSVPRKGLSTIL